ncbi:MAG: plastocyanin/azurin family copper-binding protein [Nitrospirota bacterium]
MRNSGTDRWQVAKPCRDLAACLAVLQLSISFFPHTAGGTTGNGVTGRVLFNSEPADGAVVFLQPPPGLSFAPSSAPHTIRQEKLRFEPDFLVVPAGATIRFENHDDEIHNIHSRAAENRFDTGAHLPGTVKEVTLKNPGAVPIRCRTHQSMRGLIIVAPSPYFAVADKLGRFEIPNVPPGHYRLEAWHPRLTAEERDRGAVDMDLDMGRQVVDLRFTAKAPAGTDLTETTDRDWISVVEQVRTELDRAIGHWKNGSITAATSRVMSVQSRLYNESGLRDAIAEVLGKARAAEHERRLDALRKQIQGIGTASATEAVLEREAASLVAGLMRDAEKLPGS